ncbi:hypothetical protein DSECCO2_658870 [anaerobic digester metagenome]
MCRYHDGGFAEPFGQLLFDLRPHLLVHQVDLVDRDERGDVDPVADHRVDEVVLRGTVADQDVGVDDLVLREDRADLFEIEIDGADGVQPDTAVPRLSYGDIGSLPVDPDAGIVELAEKDVRVLLVEDVDQDEDQVGAPHHGDDLFPAPFAHGGAGDEAGNIQDLDLCAPVLHRAGDDGDGREGVIRRLAEIETGEPVEQRTLSDGWETDQDNGGVSRFLHGVTLAAPGGGHGPGYRLIANLREFRLEATDVLGGRLVVRGILDLVFKFPYLLFDAAHYCRYRYAGQLLIDVCDGDHGLMGGSRPG